jgi:hypothetical protein
MWRFDSSAVGGKVDRNEMNGLGVEDDGHGTENLVTTVPCDYTPTRILPRYLKSILRTYKQKRQGFSRGSMVDDVPGALARGPRVVCRVRSRRVERTD